MALGGWLWALGYWPYWPTMRWRDNQEIAIKGQRAWIAPLGAVQLPEGLLKTGAPFRYDIQYQNTGREPALNVNTAPGQAETFLLPPKWRTGEWADFKVGENYTCNGAMPISGGPVVYPSGLLMTSSIHLTINETDRIGQIITPSSRSFLKDVSFTKPAA